MSQQPFEIRIPDLVRNGVLLWALLGFVLIFGLISSIYTVEAESEGVILRFGKAPKDNVKPDFISNCLSASTKCTSSDCGETIEARVRLCDRRRNQLNQFSDRRSRDRKRTW